MIIFPSTDEAASQCCSIYLLRRPIYFSTSVLTVCIDIQVCFEQATVTSCLLNCKQVLSESKQWLYLIRRPWASSQPHVAILRQPSISHRSPRPFKISLLTAKPFITKRRIILVCFFTVCTFVLCKRKKNKERKRGGRKDNCL